MQKRCHSFADALELRLFCIKPLIYGTDLPHILFISALSLDLNHPPTCSMWCPRPNTWVTHPPAQCGVPGLAPHPTHPPAQCGVPGLAPHPTEPPAQCGVPGLAPHPTHPPAQCGVPGLAPHPPTCSMRCPRPGTTCWDTFTKKLKEFSINTSTNK